VSSCLSVIAEQTNSGLWSFLAAWRALFDRFDEDQSGHISFDEYVKALVAFGYRLSSSFVNLLYTTYDKSAEGKMSFDLFVQSCIILKRMTDVFKKYDDDRDGYITLSFEEFLTGGFRSFFSLPRSMLMILQRYCASDESSFCLITVKSISGNLIHRPLSTAPC